MKDINVISVNSITGKVSFDFSKGSEIVRGRKALLQKITLSLLNDRGSNAYDTNKGSTIPQLIGGSYTEGDEDVVKTLIIIGVGEIEQQLLQEQTVLVFPEDELDSKLKSMEVFGINFNSSEASWDVKVLVRTAANNIGIINL